MLPRHLYAECAASRSLKNKMFVMQRVCFGYKTPPVQSLIETAVKTAWRNRQSLGCVWPCMKDRRFSRSRMQPKFFFISTVHCASENLRKLALWNNSFWPSSFKIHCYGVGIKWIQAQLIVSFLILILTVSEWSNNAQQIALHSYLCKLRFCELYRSWMFLSL